MNVLTAVTAFGWSVNDQLAHLRACHDILGGGCCGSTARTTPTGGREPASLAARCVGPTGTVTDMIGKRFEYSTLYYGDWMPRHERSHLGHMRRVLGAATSRS